LAWRSRASRPAQDLGHLGLKPLVGVVGLVGGVGHLGAVQRDGADVDHAGRGAQPQRLPQEAGKRSLVPHAEAGDGHVVGGLVAGQDPEGDVLGAAAFDLPGGAHADAVRVQEHPQQGLGVVGGVAVPVGAVHAVEGRQVELVDHVEDEPSQVLVGQPVAQVRREQEGLVAVYRFAAFVPNANCFLNVNGDTVPSRRQRSRPSSLRPTATRRARSASPIPPTGP
jgi:hypothetical protein